MKVSNQWSKHPPEEGKKKRANWASGRKTIIKLRVEISKIGNWQVIKNKSMKSKLVIWTD